MSVKVFQGVTISRNVLGDNADLFRPKRDPVELIVQKEAKRVSRHYGILPFVVDERDYFRAVELVRRGEPVGRVVAFYSAHPQLEAPSIDDVAEPTEFDFGSDKTGIKLQAPRHNGTNGHHDNGYPIKPSRNVYDREEVNSHFRIPDYKKRSHKDPKKPIGDGTQVQYGKFTTLVDTSRATDFLSMVFGQRSRYDDGDIGSMMEERHNFFEFKDDYGTDIAMLSPSTYKGVSRDRAVGTKISRPQYKAFLNLLKELRTPNNQEGRHGRVLKLYERLERYPTSFLPVRSMHDNLMNALDVASNQNLRVEVTLTLPRHVGHQVEIGYEIIPYEEPERKATRREEVIQKNNRPRFINTAVQPTTVYGNGMHRPSETRMYATHNPHPRLQRTMAQFSR